MDIIKQMNDVSLDALYHKSKYVRWAQEAAKVQVNWDEWNELVSSLEEKGHLVHEQRGSKTVRSLWAKNKSYRFEDMSKDPTLYVREVVGGRPIYYVYFTYLDGEKANRPKGAGSSGFNTVNEKFLKLYGLTLREAFGEISCSNGKTAFDKCVNSVKYAIYLKESIKGLKLSNLYKADLSSAWPSAICEDLPDLPHAKYIKGYAAPTKEYPIAYYLKSGHIAEWGKYDTHEWRKNRWYGSIEHQSKMNFKPRKNHDVWETFEDVEEENEITVLVPISKYTLRPVIEDMYATKEDKSNIFNSMWYKAMLNSFIGFMRSNTYNPNHYMGHISALAYARATHKMMAMADILVSEGNTPLYFAIDSIIWLGKGSSLTTKTKKLGAFMEEATAAEGIIITHGQYCLEVNGKIILERHQGITSSDYIQKDINTLDEYIKNMNEPVEKIRGYDKETHRFIMTRRIKI
jgi:hypothetical protein